MTEITNTLSLPEKVRADAADVMAQAHHVRIDTTALESYVSFLLDKYPLVTSFDPSFHFLAKDNKALTAAYIFALDSINFGSGTFHIAKAAGIELEYDVIARGLKKAFEQSKFTTPAEWEKTDSAQCHNIFGVPQNIHPALDDLMAQFARHLQATGKQLTTNFNGDVLTCIAEAQGSAARMTEILAGWDGFNDVATYHGKEVSIFKRAQIMTADLHLAKAASFADIGTLTCFADNMVPHVLRTDGILVYAAPLADKIDRGVLLEAGSEEEVELRCAAIHAVELLCQAATKLGKDVTSVNLDHIIWARGYEPAIFAKLSHRCLSTFY